MSASSHMISTMTPSHRITCGSPRHHRAQHALPAGARQILCTRHRCLASVLKTIHCKPACFRVCSFWPALKYLTV